LACELVDEEDDEEDEAELDTADEDEVAAVSIESIRSPDLDQLHIRASKKQQK